MPIAKAGAGTDPEEAPRVGQSCGYTIRSDDVLIATDATQDERIAFNPFVTIEPHIRFYASAPLLYMRQLLLVALCLLDPLARDLALGDKAACVFK